MNYKRSTKNTKGIKTNKKASKSKKISTLRLDNDAEIPAKTKDIKDVECFKIKDIDINKIKVSDKKLYKKNIINISIMCL